MKKGILLGLLSLLTIVPVKGFAAFVTLNTRITAIAVNGGSDVANPGTSCVNVADTVSSVCAGGYIAIPNNNSKLLAVALAAKTAGNDIWLYYDDAGSFHCPGLVMTPCSVISIMAK